MLGLFLPFYQFLVMKASLRGNHRKFHKESKRKSCVALRSSACLLLLFVVKQTFLGVIFWFLFLENLRHFMNINEKTLI